MSEVYIHTFTKTGTSPSEFFDGKFESGFIDKTSTTVSTGIATRAYWCQDGKLFVDVDNFASITSDLLYNSWMFPKVSLKKLFIDDMVNSIIILKPMDGSYLNNVPEVVEHNTLEEAILKWSLVYNDVDDMVIKPPVEDSTVHFYIRKTRTRAHAKNNERYNVLNIPFSIANTQWMQIFPLQNYDTTKPVSENFNLFKIPSDIFEHAYTFVYSYVTNQNEQFDVVMSERDLWIFGNELAIGIGLCKTALRNDAPFLYRMSQINITNLSYIQNAEVDSVFVEYDGNIRNALLPNHSTNDADLAYACPTLCRYRSYNSSSGNNARVEIHSPFAELNCMSVVGTPDLLYKNFVFINNEKYWNAFSTKFANSSVNTRNICVKL